MRAKSLLPCLMFAAYATVMNEPTEAAEEGHVRKPLPSDEVIAKLPKDGGEEFNRLVFEKSPYLLQHARNPVDWRPWGEEAFAEAKKTGKPVLMSIGYTTCHWCHVMEHESFEDPEVAKLMNEWFVCIKVNREERPDVDEVYMTVTQAMTGGGGWPMTVVMTEDKRPFFAGTYFPKEDRGGRMGFKSLMARLHEAWTDDKGKVEAVANNVKEQLAGFVSGEAGGELGVEQLSEAFRGLAEKFDKQRGGFGRAPKFPTPPILSFLLRYHKRTGDAEALAMVETTLREMRLGGMYDQVGFGTHRYSTDAEWLVPHFEKMLYDQALMAAANVEAFQVTGKEEYARTAREIFTYVLRDMTAPEGGFYSAEDADSEGEEGKFYTWTTEEVIEVLGKDEGEWYAGVFGFEGGGNWIDEATREKPGTNIPHLEGVVGVGDRARAEAARVKLFAHREKRVHPQKDDKVLTDWNGLMISALARGGQALGDESYTAAAKKAADFVLETLRRKDGRLLKRYRAGDAGLTAHLEDYAFMVLGLIDLYEATFDVRYLREAVGLNEAMLEHFWDDKAGGLFMTANDSEKLLVRAKKIYGGAIPSGNAVAALNLLRLARMTGKVGYEERYDTLVKAFSGDVVKSPSAFPQLLLAVDFAVGSSYEVVVVGKDGSAGVAKMAAALRRPFLPNKVVVFRPDDGSDSIPAVSEIAGYTETQRSLAGEATVYVCKNFACNLPTTQAAKMLESLNVAK